MLSIPFSNVTWNTQFLVLDKNTYNLIHLNIADAAYGTGSHGVVKYTVIHNRTNRTICELLVSQGEIQDFRAFQNALLTSKLAR